jgi:Spy/CpxP family protein refolding chaperone
MSHKHLFIHLLVGLPLLAVLALHIFRHHHGCPFHAFHGRHFEKLSGCVVRRIAGKLDLDDRQKAALAGIRDVVLANRESFRSDAEIDIRSLLGEIEKDTLDQAVLNRLAKKHRERLEAMQSSVVEKFAAFHASLTPAQKQKLAAMVKKHHQNRHP